MKLEYRESRTLKGGLAYSDELTCLPGNVYDFSKEEAEIALRDFPNNFFPVATKAKEKKATEVKKEEGLKPPEAKKNSKQRGTKNKMYANKEGDK